MPSYYSSRPMGGSLPLTPPDSGSGYAFRSINYPSDPYVPQQARHDGSYDYHNYMSSAMPQASSAYPYSQSNLQYTSLPPIQNSYYEPVGAPILPPLRIGDHRPTVAGDYQRQAQQEQREQLGAAAAREQQRQAAKEEKPTGGVSAKLDYDMERMTDFVTEATQSIFQHQMQSHPSFRKWVHQVLSATRLPSATILLSLHYLNDRLVKHPSSVQSGENQIYRLLAVALILGSKFLDDNTFINRSWSDVTAIKVSELNLLEMKWLGLIQYQLHIDPSCLQEWLDSWQSYDAEYVAKRQQARLSPLNTNVHRHGTRQNDRYSPYPTPSTASTLSFAPTPVSARSTQYSTPAYSAVDPWASSNDRRGLDEYYRSQHKFNAYDDSSNKYPTYGSQSDAARKASDEYSRNYGYPQSTHPSYYQTPAYNSAWSQQGWNVNSSHRYDCACSTCAYQVHYSYAMNSGYAAQPVMG